MKINYAAIIVGILTLSLSFFLAITRHNDINTNLIFWLSLARDFSFLLLFGYFIYILKIAKEKTYIVSWFCIFTIIRLINCLIYYLPLPISNKSVIIAIAMTVFQLLNICMIVISLQIKNSVLRIPFMVFAITYMIVIVINFIIPLLSVFTTTFRSYSIIADYKVYTVILPEIVVIYVIYNTNAFFEKSKIKLPLS